MISSTQREWLYRLILFILLMCFVLWSVVHLGGSSRSDDEGTNLMKARMVQEGYLLHRDIWSDQPPFFTLCLAWAFDLFGESVLVARSVVVAFACLALASTAWMARLLGGRVSSLVAVVFLAFSPQFLELSRSVMIGLPAHALATLSMACGLMALRTKREIWLLAAPVAVAASLLTKPLHAFLFAPLSIIIWLWGKSSEGTVWHRWGRKALLLTFASLVPLLLVIGLFGGPLLVEQVAGTYFERQQSESFRFGRVVSHSAARVSRGGLLHWTGLVLALYGLVVTWRRRDSMGMAVSVWFLGGLIAVYSQTRFRVRYVVLLSFPVAGLLSIGLRDLVCSARLAWTRPRRWLPLGVGAVVVTALTLGAAGKVRWALVQTCCEELRAEEEAVAMLRSIGTPGGYAISDDGILPFRGGLLAPPQLTVISGRRIGTGQLTAGTLIDASQTYRPEAIVLWDKRLASLPEYVDWVEQHYCLAREWSNTQHLYVPCEMLDPCDGCLVQLGDFSGITGWTLSTPDEDNRVVAPGDSLLLTVRWQTMQPTDADYHVFLHLGEDAIAGQWDGRPQQGQYPTYRWLQGEGVLDHYTLEVRADAPPGHYPLWVGMYDWATEDRLLVKDAEGYNIGTTALLTYVRVGRPEFEVPPISQPQEAMVGDRVRLLGHDLASKEAQAGGAIGVTL
jgi:hypothetical protein